MKRSLLLIIAILPFAFQLFAENGAPLHTKQVLSQVYTIDKIYRSMEGPNAQQQITLEDSARPELLWVKSVKVDIVGEDGKTPEPSEFMCHMNLDLDPARHQLLMATPYQPSSRLLTLAQGVLEAKLPDGYGYPVVSSEPLTVATQVLNHNIVNPGNLKVRHRVTIEYLRDAELKEPMKPLVNIGASGTVLLDESHPMTSMASMPGMSMASPPLQTSTGITGGSTTEAHGANCLIGPRAPNALMTSDYVDPQGRKLVGHWVVPPGKQVNHSDITWFMALPFDTSLHFALAHLHPFAESLTLRDTTTGKDLWTARASGPRKGIGLTHVDAFASDDGVPMFKDHKYELISVYDNKLKVNTDSMASMYFGFSDPKFHHPDPVQLAARAADVLDFNSTIIIRTPIGDLAAQLDRQHAPLTVQQFVRMVRAGAFDHASFTTVDPGRGAEVVLPDLTPEQKKLASAPLEAGNSHLPGTLSYCPGESGFSIVLNKATFLDGRCTAFGQLGPGAGVIRAMVDAPRDSKGVMATPVEITKIELVNGNDLASTILAPPRSQAALH